MPMIPRQLIDDVTKQLNGISYSARKVISEILLRANVEDVAELRKFLIEYLIPILQEAAELSASASADFYNELRAYVEGEPFDTVVDSGFSRDAAEGAIRSFLTEKNLPFLERLLHDRADYEVKRASGHTIKSNARRDPKCKRYARVPAGDETCTFCIMLASRGFVYLSEDSAGGDDLHSGPLDHYHAHCDCRIVPGFSGMTVEGYNPDELYRVWKDSQKKKEDKT